MRVYKITNLQNGKGYVGKTSGTVEGRFSKHKKNALKGMKRHLYSSMNCYGHDSFAVEELEICKTEDELNERERFWIRELGCRHPNGYNMTDGGDGGNTLRDWSEEDKKALFKAQGEKRRGKRSDKFKQTMSEASKIREALKTDEDRLVTSAKISETLKRKYADGLIAITPPPRYGKDHHQFICVDVDVVVNMIREGKTLKSISKDLGVSPHGIRSRLKETTGKNYTEWVRENGIHRKINTSGTN